MNQTIIDIMISKGGKRWQKNGMDRIYFKAGQLGLDCEFYKSGNISGAKFQGERISNSEAGRMKASITYYNVLTDTIVSDNETLKKAVEKFVQFPTVQSKDA